LLNPKTGKYKNRYRIPNTVDSSNTDNVEYYVIWLIPQQGEWILVNGNIPKTTLTYNWSITNDLKEGNYTLRVYAVNPRFMQGKFGNWLSYGEAQITLGK